MVERSEYLPGVPCWVDTLQPDPPAALRFYRELMGWTFDGPGPGDYYVAQLRGREVAGVGKQPMSGAPAMWNTYVSVENADDAAKKVERAGGKVVREPFDVLPAGRVAVSPIRRALRSARGSRRIARARGPSRRSARGQ